MGSVCDLTAAQSDTESQAGTTTAPTSLTEAKEEDEQGAKDAASGGAEQQQEQGEVGITVTSPKGTVTEMDGDGNKKEEEEKAPLLSEEQEQQQKEGTAGKEEFINSQGVMFTPAASSDVVDESGALIPYGLPCVRELFRFIIALVNPHDPNNHDSMIQIALSLLATALETAADGLDRFDTTLVLIKDDLARNLVSLLSSERIATFSVTLWLSYILLESQRRHLKYQVEIFLNKLVDVICSESQKVTYEHKELALDFIVRLYRVPGLLTQLYLNFDCDLYTSNTFEDLTKMLSKNAFPVTGLYSTHFLSLDALLTVIEVIETQCQKRILSGGKASTQQKSAERASLDRPEGEDGKSEEKIPQDKDQKNKGEDGPSVRIPTHEEVMALKHRKKLMTTVTEQFNAKPAKGVAYMQECGLLKGPPEPMEIARFMRQNPHLDKKQLGEYISNRKNLVILEAFCQSFDFCNVRIDEALRQFLETFRLPGRLHFV